MTNQQALDESKYAIRQLTSVELNAVSGGTGPKPWPWPFPNPTPTFPSPVGE